LAITPVRYSVKSSFQREGHQIDVADYAGQKITRPDVNSPGGEKQTYSLHAVVPHVQDGTVSNTGVNLDVTDLVLNGQVEVH
jgi:hypothetical protein